MLSSQVKFSADRQDRQTDRQTDGHKKKKLGPDLSMWGHKNL